MGGNECQRTGSEHAALSFQLNMLSVRGTSKTHPAPGVDLGAPLACRERGDLAAEESGGNWAARRELQLLSSLAPSPSVVCQRSHA